MRKNEAGIENADLTSAPHLAMNAVLRRSERAFTELESAEGRAGLLWLLSKLKDGLLVPFAICVGTMQTAMTGVAWSGLWTAIVLGFGWLFEQAAGPGIFTGKTTGFGPWLLLTLCASVVFPAPSSIGGRAYKAEFYRRSVAMCEPLGSVELIYLEAVAGFLKAHREEVGQRLAMLAWGLNALWALTLYVAAKAWESQGDSIRPETALFVGGACLIAAIVVHSYRAGVNGVFVLAEATLQKFILDKKTEQKANKAP